MPIFLDPTARKVVVFDTGAGLAAAVDEACCCSSDLTITNIAPDYGPVTGGAQPDGQITTVLTGTGFVDDETGKTLVQFGTQGDGYLDADSITVVDDTTIQCVAPEWVLGNSQMVDVKVINPDTAEYSFPNGYQYCNFLASITPIGDFPTLGGVYFFIRGDFTGGSGRVETGVQVFFSFNSAPPSGSGNWTSWIEAELQGTNNDSIDLTFPAEPTPIYPFLSFARVKLVNPDGVFQQTPEDGTGLIRVQDDLQSISPSSGPDAGGTVVTIHGNGFFIPGETQVVFGRAGAAAGVSVIDAFTLEAVTPPFTLRPGKTQENVVLTVTTSRGSDSQGLFFTYVSGSGGGGLGMTCSPSSGSTSGIEVIYLYNDPNGPAWGASQGVTFGGVNVYGGVVVDGHTMWVYNPPHASGIVDVIARSNGLQWIAPAGFTYYEKPAYLALSGPNVIIAGGQFQYTYEVNAYDSNNQIVTSFNYGSGTNFNISAQEYGGLEFLLDIYVNGNRADNAFGVHLQIVNGRCQLTVQVVAHTFNQTENFSFFINNSPISDVRNNGLSVDVWT